MAKVHNNKNGGKAEINIKISK